MIRREATSAAGPGWVLISQVEHARLAYAVARDWGGEGYTLAGPREEFLAAVACHDDGWAMWEQRQPVEPQSGRPIDFLETPVREALGVWTRSIDVCRQIGPLAGALVAGHFLALLSHHSKAHSGPDALLVDDFRERFEASRTQWLAEWADDRPGDSAEWLRRAEIARQQLRFFDLLSLWFCMEERTEPREFAPPDGPPITITPLGQDYYRVTPWPLNTTQTSLRALGRQVPARRYTSIDDLAQTPSRQMELHFHLVPGG